MSDAVVKAAPAARSIDVVAELFVKNASAYKIRKTASKTFRCLTLTENENANWKKGLVYMVNRYAKGVNLELWLYSTKGGAHLAEFKDKFEALASDTIKCEPLGHAVKLRTQILDATTEDDADAQIAAFIAAVDPTVTTVRDLVPAAVVKEKKAKKVKTTPVDTTLPEGVIETTPVAKAPKAKSKAKAA